MMLKTVTNDPQHGPRLVMDANKEELANAPSFKSKRDQDDKKQAAERTRKQPRGAVQLPGDPAKRPGTNSGTNSGTN